jgi:hypothetical protein
MDVGAATHAAALALLVRAMFFSDLDPPDDASRSRMSPSWTARVGPAA